MTRCNRGAAVALAALLVSGCSPPPPQGSRGSAGPSTPTAVTQAATRGVEAAVSTIPWSQVGAGCLRATVCCGNGTSLLDYDPAANTTSVLLGPPLNGGGVMAAVPYPGQR